MEIVSSRKITTFLMFEGNAEDAMTFYISLFDDAEVIGISRYGAAGPGKEGSVQHDFTFTPAVSLFVQCQDEAELDRLFAALAEQGAVLMPLGDYGFSPKFGWVNDRFGVSWQLNLPA